MNKEVIEYAMKAPPEGKILQISERTLRALYDAAMKADEERLLGTCQDHPDYPALVYCRYCWAMQETQIKLYGIDDEQEDGQDTETATG